MVPGNTTAAPCVAAWQRAVGYVPQHIYLADTSIAENIAFGVPRAEIDAQAVERAARAAQIHAFIANELKDGYATPIGDRGIRLSGGQRQRIGIVGRTDTSKSTLMDILLGMLEPQVGSLRVDDMPIDANNVATWQELSLSPLVSRYGKTDELLTLSMYLLTLK